jgi:HD-like signal output (HDOD) protein
VLFLAAFLQEMGKILIASEVIQNDETISFASEIENSNNLSVVERAYSNVTSAEVTAMIFEYWGFDTDFVEMIRHSDDPSFALSEVKEYATALNIVKTIVPINKPFSEMSINFGLKIASDALYDTALLEESILQIMSFKE